MIDIEKVKKGLECCSNTGKGRCESSECPYWIDSICCIDEMQSDALTLLKEQEKPNGKCVNECECWDSAYERGKQDALKEQEAVKPVLDEQTGRIWLCGKCGTYVGFEDNDPHDPNEFDKYCRECGRPVLWEGR